MNEMPEEKTRALALIGALGGMSGTGKKKRRDPKHYTHVLPEARRKAKEAREKKGGGK